MAPFQAAPEDLPLVDQALRLPAHLVKLQVPQALKHKRMPKVHPVL